MVLKQDNLKDIGFQRVHFGRGHIFFPGGAGGNFLLSLLANMYNLSIPMGKISETNEYIQLHKSRAITQGHLLDMWGYMDEPAAAKRTSEDWENYKEYRMFKNYIFDCLTQRKYPPKWKECLELAKNSKTHFIIINSKDQFYTQNLAGLKGSFKEGWQDKFYVMDRNTSGKNQHWNQIWGHYKWIEEQFIENNIPCLYFEYHDLYLDKVKESLEKICNMWGPVDNLDKYVKMINAYSEENYRLLKEYKSDIYYSRHG